MEPEITIAPKAEFLFAEAHRYKALHGGRGSAKSYSVAGAALLQACSETQKWLCCREFMGTLRESVHSLLCTRITECGLLPYFDIQQSAIRCKYNGSVFLFAGLQNVRGFKSMDAIDRVWIEEAEGLTQASWDILDPTVRKPNSEIWLTWNPQEETDPVHKMFVANPLPGAKVVQMNWRDNPWFPEVLRKQLEHKARTDPEAYEHIWEGGTIKKSDDQVLKGKWVIDAFVRTPDVLNPRDPGLPKVVEWFGPYDGADWGFSVDPLARTRSWIRIERCPTTPWDQVSRELLIEYDGAEVGVPISKTAEKFESWMPGAKDVRTGADSARPEMISHLRDAGHDIEAAEKWPNSVEAGIEYLRDFDKIIIHPRCRDTIQEARLWKYKRDKLTNEVTKILKPGNDHCWDSVRYAHWRMIRAISGGTSIFSVF